MMTLKKAREILKDCEVNVAFEAKHTVPLAVALKKPLKKSEIRPVYITFSVWKSGNEIEDGHLILFVRYFVSRFGNADLCKNSGYMLDYDWYDEQEVTEACEKLIPEILELYEERK